MIKNLSDALGFIKLETPYWFTIAVVSGVLFGLSFVVGGVPGVGAIVVACQGVAGVVCVVSFCVLLSRGLWVLCDRWCLVSRGRKVLKRLSPGERALLSEYIARDTKTMALGIVNGTARGLESAKVLFRPSRISPGRPVRAGCPFNLKPWAWEELKANPGLLEPELSKLKESLEAKRSK